MAIPKQPVFVGVVGHAASGKSTIICSLSGCPTKSSWQYIIDQDTHESFYVAASSLQEDPYFNKLKNKVLPVHLQYKRLENLLKQIKKRNKCRGIVMAIQPSKPTKRLPIEDIFELARKSGFKLFCFVINPDYHNNSGPTLNNIKQRLSSNIQYTGHIDTLDARRFALINANKIQYVTQLVW